MRIISGSHRGRQIFPDKSFSARPTTDFAKENLFNVLTNYMDLEDISALDLFSDRLFRKKIPGFGFNRPGIKI